MGNFYRILTLIIIWIIATNSLSKASHPGIDGFNPKFLPYLGIRINKGARYTNKRIVQVEVKSIKSAGNLIEEMQIGTDPKLNNTPWQPYTNTKIDIELNGKDGEKVIYARLKDKAGNLSPIESNLIILDTKPPLDCKIVINKGAKFTNDRLGRILINAYTSEPGKMILCNSKEFKKARWENYVKSKKWTIDIVGEGEKTVYAKFMDRAGNESEMVSAKIIYDITPPQNGSLSINDGEKYTRSRKLLLNIRSEDATKIRITGKGVNKTFDFEPDDTGVMKVKWSLDSLEGIKTIRVFFMDEAGNKTIKTQDATIHYKFRGPPAPLLVINRNAKFTNDKEGKVNLKITSRTNPEHLTMMISNNVDFKDSNKEKFSPIIKRWALPAEKDGLKTVYIRLYDEAGNPSIVALAEIILDRTPPIIHSFSINDQSEWSKSLKVAITTDVQDAATMKIYNKEAIPEHLPWEKYKSIRTNWTMLPGDGVKNVYAVFRDEAGNQTEIVSSEINLDTQPPTGTIKINNGAKFTNHPEGLVKLNIEYTDDAIGIVVVNKPEFEDVKLQPVIHEITNWKLEGEDNTKTVFMRLQDRAGNMSKVYTSSIILDRQAPTGCSIIINNGDKWLRNKNRRVSLSLRAEGASTMMISNDNSFKDSEWIPFRTAISWTVDKSEGPNLIFAKFKDAAGNESEILNSVIISDFNPPKINLFSSNDGVIYCNDPQKTILLRIDVTDAKLMAISNQSLRDTSRATNIWETYSKEKNWILEGEDGLKTISAIFKDEAGNVTEEYNLKIVLDRTPPSEPQISILKDAKWLTNPDGKADLELKAIGAGHMMISNDPAFENAKWEKYNQVKKSWQLRMKGKQTTVYVKFRDEAGNESETVKDDILIDINPPTNPSITLNDGDKYVELSSHKVVVTLYADGATLMRISPNKNFTNTEWIPYEKTLEKVLNDKDGKITLYAQFSDEAGNLSKIVNTSIILDTTPPRIISFIINDGSEWSNAQDKKVKLHIKADGAKEMMIDDQPGMKNGKWEVFKSDTNYELPGEDGEKNIYLKLRDEVGNVSKTVHAIINLKRSF